MSTIHEKIKKLEQFGIYCAKPTDTIKNIVNLEECELEDLAIEELEDFMNRISQHIIYLYQELNKARAIENATGRAFKTMASPVIRKAPKEELSGRSSVEERLVYASLQSKTLEAMYDAWQEAVEDVILYSDLPVAYTEKLNVFKKVHSSKTSEKRELTK